MQGIILSMIAGIFISLQSVFNTRASEKIGVWGVNTFVHGTGFLFALTILLLMGDSNFKNIGTINKLYLTGGIMGVTILFSIMKGVSQLGPTYSIAIVLVSQILAATIIDCYGLFEVDPKPFHLLKLLGIIVILVGIVIFKWKE